MFTPAEVAKNVIGIGKNKAALPAGRMLVLSIMAGIFIALAAVGSNTISCTVSYRADDGASGGQRTVYGQLSDGDPSHRKRD